MSSSAVERKAPAVPSLAPTPATTLTADDVVAPRLYVANKMSTAVGEGLVRFGDLFVANGADDPEPIVGWKFGSTEPGVLAHVLHMWKGKSWDKGVKGGPLERYTYTDPNAPVEAWITYNYTLYLPEVDPDMPVKFLLTRSGRRTAERINTKLMRDAKAGPAWSTAFRLTADKKTTAEFTYAVAQAQVVPANPEHVQAAGELFSQIADGLAEQESRTYTTNTGEEPTI